MQEVSLILRRYKEKNGEISFPAVLSIPTSERLPTMAAESFERALKLIIGAITVALESINLKKSLNALQILSVAEMILDTSVEDNLSLEDLLLFLQNMVAGKYKIPGEMLDVPRFMSIFEIYREDRHQKLVQIRMDNHAQYSCLGDTGRSYKEDPLSEHFSRLGDTIGHLKDSLKETKRENEILKKVDKF